MKNTIKLFVLMMMTIFACSSGAIANQNQGPSNQDQSSSMTPKDRQNYLYAQCLNQKGAKLYTIQGCPHCREQKEVLGSLLEVIDIVDCTQQRSQCGQAYAEANKNFYNGQNKVKGFPTWLLPSGQELPAGYIEEVAKAAGCPLISEADMQQQMPDGPALTNTASQAPQVMPTTSMAANQTESLNQCIARSGLTMYGTDWCPHCKSQKSAFGDSFRYVKYVNCDKDQQVCSQRGISGYPTLLLPDGREIQTGSLENISKALNCR